ncbi:uncharacterized protein RAG0_15361 [Rhynchosporium agropyri]|uniref:Uncharacterized protein n=1 Tax=Rhynchosporium agropyri TaxID=914238 RepID=A0A1E1LKS8_9HELO|nr:uncharacterized protein RAG0_15361 [Rhynchosporium agropyri]
MDTTKGSPDYGRDKVKIELPSAGDHYRRLVSEDLLQSRHLSRLELQSDRIRGLPCIYNNSEPVSEPDFDGDAPRVMPEIVHGDNPRHIPVSLAKLELLSTASSAGLPLLHLSSSAPSSTGQYSCNTTTHLATPSGEPMPARLAREATPATTSFTSSRVIDGVDPGDGEGGGAGERKTVPTDGHLGVTSRAAPVCIRLLMLYIKSRGIENGQLAEDLVAQDKWYLSGVKEALRIRARFHGRIHSRRSSTASRQPSFQFPTPTSHQTCDSQAPLTAAPLTAAPLTPAAVAPGMNEHNTPNERIHGMISSRMSSILPLSNETNQMALKPSYRAPEESLAVPEIVYPEQRQERIHHSRQQQQQWQAYPAYQQQLPRQGQLQCQYQHFAKLPANNQQNRQDQLLGFTNSWSGQMQPPATSMKRAALNPAQGQQGQVSGQFGQFENNYIVPSGDGCNPGGRAMLEAIGLYLSDGVDILDGCRGDLDPLSGMKIEDSFQMNHEPFGGDDFGYGNGT